MFNPNLCVTEVQVDVYAIDKGVFVYSPGKISAHCGTRDEFQAVISEFTRRWPALICGDWRRSRSRLNRLKWSRSFWLFPATASRQPVINLKPHDVQQIASVVVAHRSAERL